MSRNTPDKSTPNTSPNQTPRPRSKSCGRRKTIQSEACTSTSRIGQNSKSGHSLEDLSRLDFDNEEPKKDPINTEFLYYSATLKEIASKLTEEKDRQRIIPWIKKMFRPEYHSSILREKRNRYLLFMTLSLLNDETYSILHSAPPVGAVPDISTLPDTDIERAEWEKDKMWPHILSRLPEEKRNMSCSIHTDDRECKSDHDLDSILDDEFKYLLHLAQPYVFLLRSQDDRDKINAWFEILCRVHGNSCSTMRGIRNDYMMTLLGYLQELRVTGPFIVYPKHSKPLAPLCESAKMTASYFPTIDPTCSDVNDFLAGQPLPDEGAFCYVAVTGDIIYQDLPKI